MATVAEIKARLAGLNRRSSKNPDIWKPKDEHDARLLRNPFSDDPFIEKGFHFNIGDAREILCPKVNFGEECVICDFADALRSWKDINGKDKPEKERKADFEVFKKIQVVSKVIVPMVERQRDADGKPTGEISQPAWWPLTGNQAQQILEVCADADRLAACDIDPTDEERVFDALFSPKKAFDFHVSFKKPGEKGNNKTFTMVEIKAKYKPSPLTGDPKRDAELAQAIKDPDEVYPKVPAAEVALALKKFIGGGMQVEASAKPEAKEEKYPSVSRERAEKAGTRSVDEAFGDLLNAK